MECDYCGRDLTDKTAIKVLNLYDGKNYYVCSRKCLDNWLDMKYGAFYESNFKM